MKICWGVIKYYQQEPEPHVQGRFKTEENLITVNNELLNNKFNDFFINIGANTGKINSTCIYKPS